MNMVALIGRVADEPDLRHTPLGRTVCTFGLEVPRAGGGTADFFFVVAWESQAEMCGKYLAKGRRVSVEGRLHHSAWTAENGEMSLKVEVSAHRISLLPVRQRQVAS